MRMGAEGIKIKVGGRLGGAEIARSEEFKQGRTPLHTLRMDIDYASVYAMTVYGKIGIKVWICKGEVLGKRDLNPNFSAELLIVVVAKAVLQVASVVETVMVAVVIAVVVESVAAVVVIVGGGGDRRGGGGGASAASGGGRR